MTVEYILLLFAVFFIGLKYFAEAPKDAFKKSGPVLALRVEKQLITGDGFKPNNERNAWDAEP
ncbi:hypothetical protein [Bdellovibrio sp. HCB337]|uniref:hypothetical protein n=1 Tax=Bdellovibrio sp. HCB337 TaxID=3394358 RepID=UPI0039A5E205